jgi:hypothetical protein
MIANRGWFGNDIFAFVLGVDPGSASRLQPLLVRGDKLGGWFGNDFFEQNEPFGSDFVGQVPCVVLSFEGRTCHLDVTCRSITKTRQVTPPTVGLRPAATSMGPQNHHPFVVYSVPTPICMEYPHIKTTAPRPSGNPLAKRQSPRSRDMSGCQSKPNHCCGPATYKDRLKNKKPLCIKPISHVLCAAHAFVCPSGKGADGGVCRPRNQCETSPILDTKRRRPLFQPHGWCETNPKMDPSFRWDDGGGWGDRCGGGNKGRLG